MKVRTASASLLVLLLSAMGAFLFATTVIPMSIEELTAAATHVVRGHVIESWSSWDTSLPLIYSYPRFKIDKPLKGTAPSVVLLKQLGGTVGDMTLRVAGVHPWSNGESAVLFLRPSQEQDGTFSVVGLMQGDFRLRRSASGEVVADNGLYLSSATAMSSEENVHAYNSST